jgi:hypothetical protein
MARGIVVHWTAGSNEVSQIDREHYHFIVDGKGQVFNGLHSVEDNDNTSDGRYAAHTRGANSGRIGVSMAGMRGAIESPFESGPSPLTKQSWDAMVKLVAELCVRYKIKVTPETVLTHAEVEKTLGIKQKGKWDITRLPFNKNVVGAKAVGDLLRKEVTAQL